MYIFAFEYAIQLVLILKLKFAYANNIAKTRNCADCAPIPH